MRLAIIMIVVLGGCLSIAAIDRVQQPTPTPAPAKKYFIAIFSRGTAWDDKKQANEQTGFKEHSANLSRLRAEKKIPIGGRYGEKGMVIVEAQNEDEARSLFAYDVMVTSRTFTLELHQFRPFYKGTIE